MTIYSLCRSFFHLNRISLVKRIGVSPFSSGSISISSGIEKSSSVSSSQLTVDDKLSQFKERVKSGPNFDRFFYDPDLVKKEINVNPDEPFIAKRNEPVPYLDDKYLDGGGKKVYIETYGCQMNTNDTQVASKILSEHNYQIIDNIENAEIVFLMTCAIRDGAERKIWSRLNELRRLKSPSLIKQIGVIGCMAERLKTKLIEKNSCVDIVAGKLLPKLNQNKLSIQVQYHFNHYYLNFVFYSKVQIIIEIYLNC